MLYEVALDRQHGRFGGSMLIKREGAIVVACLVAAALVASWGERGWAWPRLAGAAVLALALAAPWRIWLGVTGVGDAPTEGYLAFLDHPGRAWPSLELVLSTFVDPMWLGLGVLTLVAGALAFAGGSTRPPVFVLTFLAASVATSAFVIWSETGFEISKRPILNPVIRMVLVTMLVLAPLVPLLLEAAWRGGASELFAPIRRWRLSALPGASRSAQRFRALRCSIYCTIRERATRPVPRPVPPKGRCA